MTTINSKTTKKGLVEYLTEVAPSLKGKKFKTLADSVKYTMKKFSEDANQVLREDLFLLASDIQAVLAPVAPAPVENSLKPVPKEEKKPSLRKSGKKEESTEDIAKGVLEIVNGKKDKKSENPAEKNDKGDKVTPKNLPDKAMPLADKFPESMKVEGVGSLKVNMKLKNMKEVYDVVQSGKTLYFAMYWSPRLLKQFVYDTYDINGKKFKSFPSDLDICQLVYISEEHKVAYAVSAYSEVCYPILPADLEIAEGMRYANGVEFNIYEIQE